MLQNNPCCYEFQIRLFYSFLICGLTSSSHRMDGWRRLSISGTSEYVYSKGDQWISWRQYRTITTDCWMMFKWSFDVARTTYSRMHNVSCSHGVLLGKTVPRPLFYYVERFSVVFFYAVEQLLFENRAVNIAFESSHHYMGDTLLFQLILTSIQMRKVLAIY